MGTLHKEHDNELRTELTVQDTDARIVLLAREGAARKKYEDVLTSLGVQVETVSSFQELRHKSGRGLSNRKKRENPVNVSPMLKNWLRSNVAHSNEATV